MGEDGRRERPTRAGGGRPGASSRGVAGQAGTRRGGGPQQGAGRPRGGAAAGAARTASPSRPDRAGRPPRAPRPPEPPIDADIDIRTAERAAAREVSTLAPAVAERTLAHLLMAERLVEDDPERAYAHAQVVRRLAGRLALSRETLGVLAYRTGRWAEALAELRAARRMTGAPDFLPMLADCERGLGRPERALAAASDPDAARLDRGGAVELRIVVSGARRDLGQPAAAVASLQGPDLDDPQVHDWTARLRFAYAEALLAADRRDDAVEWFRRAVAADPYGDTEARERLSELTGEAVEGDDDVMEVWADDESAD